MVDFIITSDKISVKAVDNATSQIYGSFTIENASGGILVVATSAPDNNNVTSGNSQTILLNGLFTNPDASVLNFTSIINSELGDVDNQSAIETIECLDCDGVLGGTSFTDSCGNCVGGSTGNLACIPFSPTVSVSLSNTDCDSLSDLSISVSQDPNEPDMATSLFTSDAGSFAISSMNVNDIIGSATMSVGGGSNTFNTNLIVTTIISANQVVIQSQDVNTGLILGSFTISNLNPGVSISTQSPPDNNNVTSGNAQTIIFNNVFINSGAGVLTFTTTINSEISDQDVQNFPFTIVCLCAPNSSTDVVVSCDTYTWINGVTYISSNNTATQTLTNAGGCDSVVTLNLTINGSTTSSVSVTECDTYTWNGTTYTSSGSYDYLTVNSNGCDSTATLNLTINGSTTSTTNVTIPNTYTWNGVAYTSSGVYTYSTLNAVGCDSTATLNLTILTCDAPLNPVTHTILLDRATMTWDAVSGVDHYEIRFKELGTSTWQYLNNYSTSRTKTNLSSATSYHWQVRTHCDASAFNISEWTDTITFQTMIPCANTTNLSDSIVGLDFATLTWDNDPNVWAYRIRYRKTGSWIFDTTYTNTITLSGLDNSSMYNWQVKSMCDPNGINSAIWTANHQFTTLTPCDNPSVLTVDSVGVNEAYLSWTAPVGTDHFVVLYSELGSGVWNSTTTTNTNIVLTGLATYAPYEWSLLAFCEASGLNNSDTISGNNFVTANPCTHPTGMFSSNVLLDRFTMNWNAVALADHYEIRFKEQGTAIWQMLTNINNINKTKTNLTAGTTYEWEVRSICDASGTSYSDWSATQTQATLTPCVTPLNPVSANVTLSSADLSWDNDPSVWGYRVRYRISGSWIFDTTYINSISLTGLSTASHYYWQVKAMCDANGINSSAWTATQNFTTITACASPFNLAVNQIGLTSARFVMSGPNSPDHYYLLYRVSAASSWDTITLSGADISGNYASKVVTGLTSATTYEWQVQASCQADDSNLSSFAIGNNFTTLTPCATPSNLASSVSGDDVTFSWDAVAGSVFYTLKYKQIGGSTGWQTVSNFTNPSYIVNNLGFGISYQWIVSSSCDQSGINISAFSSPDTVNTATCPAPQNIGVANIQTDQVQIYWDNNIDVHHFAARARVAGTTIWTKNIQTIYGNNRTVTGLVDGTTYEFQLRSACFNDTSSVSAWSSLQTFTTLANCNTKPSALTTSNITLSSADLSFTGTANAAAYLVRFKTVQGAWNTWVYDTLLAPTVSLSKTSLTPGTQYIWAVRAVCDLAGTNVSGWANQALFSTLAPCQDVINLTVVSNQTTTSTLKLRWTHVWNTYGYKLAFKEDASTTWDTLLVVNNTITNVTTLPFGVAGTVTSNTGNIDVVLSGLNAGTTYNWQVMNVCEASGINNSSFVNGPDGTTTDPCTTPSGLSTTAIAADNATMNWGATATAQYYALRGRVAGTTTWTINPSTIYGTSKTIYGLTAGENYEWQVRSVCSTDTSEVSDWSAIQSFSTMVNCDNAPSNPTEIGIGLNEATLTWDIQSNAQAYEVRFRKLSDPWSLNVYTTTTATSITKTGLLSDADYTWDLRAICDTVNGIQSPWTGFRTFHTEAPCADPTNPGVRANYTTLTGASVKWYGPNNTDYLVMFKETPASNWDTVIVNGVVVTNVTLLPFGMVVTSSQVGQENRVFFTGLSSATEYEWMVVAACSPSNLSSAVSGPNFTTLTPCTVPTGLSSSSLTDNATISWSAVSGATFYEFRKRAFGSSSWSGIGVEYSTNRTIWNLTPGVSYEWQVRSQCDYSGTNISDWSSIESFTTQNVCTKPTNADEINITTTTAELIWDAIPGAWGYRLMYLENGAAWNTKVVDTINTNIDAIAGLDSGATYRWRVKGICDASGQNNSPWQGWQLFSTLSSNRITAGDVNLGTNLNVYPNPTDGMFNISFISEELDNFEITVIDAFGKLISYEEKQDFVGEYTKSVDLSAYSKGIYIVLIKTQDSFVTKRIVLQ
jgi:hypothetical protein